MPRPAERRSKAKDATATRHARVSKEELLEQLHGTKPKPPLKRRQSSEELQAEIDMLDPGSIATLEKCLQIVQRVAIEASGALTPLQMLQLAAGSACETSTQPSDEAHTNVDDNNEQAGDAAMNTLRVVAAEADSLLLSLFCRQLFERAIAREIARPSPIGTAIPETPRPSTAPTNATAAADWALSLDVRRPGTTTPGWFPRRWWMPPPRVSPRPKPLAPPRSPSSTMDMPSGVISPPFVPLRNTFVGADE